MTFPKPPHLRPFLRPFSTTHQHHYHHQKPSSSSTTTTTTTHRSPPPYHKHPPPYPYGPALHYKQSDSGLYGGATIQFGNLISTKNEHKSRRTWRPNMHRKRLWSDALRRFVRVKVQARVLRTMDRCGGLDAYLLGDKPARIKELGVEGWRLRWLVMRTGRVQRRVGAEKRALGLVVGGRKKKGAVRGVVRERETLEGEVERASGEVVERIRGTGAGADGSSEAEAGQEYEELIESEAKVEGTEKQKIGMDMEKEAEGGIMAKIRGLFSRR